MQIKSFFVRASWPDKGVSERTGSDVCQYRVFIPKGVATATALVGAARRSTGFDDRLLNRCTLGNEMVAHFARKIGFRKIAATAPDDPGGQGAVAVALVEHYPA